MKWLPHLLLAATLIWVLSACLTPTPAPVPGHSSTPPHDLAPDFSLTTLDGAPVRLSALRGRWVLVNFWATWCTPCREELPYLASLATAHAERLTVLAVNMREPREAVAAFVADQELRLPVLLVPDDATLLAYNVRGLPISVLIAPSGAIVQRIVGPVPEGMIEAALLSEGGELQLFQPGSLLWRN